MEKFYLMKKNLFFLLVNVIFIILILEISLQFLYRISSGDFLINRASLPIFKTSETCCWQLKKNLILEHKTNEFSYNMFTNNNSFRVASKDDVNTNISMDHEGKTLMMLGPSFGFGWGNAYEKSYYYQISNFYKQKGFKNFINASVPGHLPSYQLCWLLNEGYKYKPDVIIQTLTSKLDLYINQNDDASLCENVCGREFVNSKGFLTTKNSYTFAKTKQYLKNSSLIFYSWVLISKTRSLFVKDNKIIENAVGLNFDKNNELKELNLNKTYENYIKLIREKLKDTKIIFLYIPDSYDVHISDRARWSHLNIDFKNSSKVYRDNINNIQENYNLIDTLPELKKQSKFNRLYFYVDTHFNNLGNKITYDIFKKYCKNNNCLN